MGRRGKEMKLAAIVGLFLIFTSLALGQSNGTITGKVISHGEPVPETAVSLVSVTDSKLKFTAIADASGNYILSNIPAGTYVINFFSYSVAGITRQQGLDWRGEVRVTRGENKTLNIDFDKPLPYNEEVVVIAAASEQPISGVSKTVDV